MTKQSKSKPVSSSLDGLTPAQSYALRLFRVGSAVTARDVADRLASKGLANSLSLARAHVRAWQAAGYVSATVKGGQVGSQGVVGKYKRVK